MIQWNQNNIVTNLKTIVLATVLVVGITLTAVFLIDLQRTDPLTEYNKKFKAYQDTVVTPVLKLNKQLKLKNDSLQLEVTKKDQQTDSIRTVVVKRNEVLQTLRIRNQELVSEVNKLPTNDSTGKFVAVINSLNDENVRLISQVSDLQRMDTINKSIIKDVRQQLTVQTLRADTLERTIRTWPMPPKPATVLSLNLPKKVVFGLGVAAGVAAQYFTQKR